MGDVGRVGCSPAQSHSTNPYNCHHQNIMVTIQAIATTITFCPKDARRTRPDLRNEGMSRRRWEERQGKGGKDIQFHPITLFAPPGPPFLPSLSYVRPQTCTSTRPTHVPTRMPMHTPTDPCTNPRIHPPAHTLLPIRAVMPPPTRSRSPNRTARASAEGRAARHGHAPHRHGHAPPGHGQAPPPHTRRPAARPTRRPASRATTPA